MTNFKFWIENLNQLPNFMFNRGNSATASDDVINTNLQPQVGTENPVPNDNNEMSAIDSGIEHLEKTLINFRGNKTNEFKKLWDKMKDKWSQIKEEPPVGSRGLGNATGDEHYVRTMQTHPNMTIKGDHQIGGSGVMGQR